MSLLLAGRQGCSRFLASAANSVSSVSAQTRYFPVPATTAAGCHRQQHPSSARKDMLMLHNSARAQGRRLFSSIDPFRVKPAEANQVPVSFRAALNKHENAKNDPRKMLEALGYLKVFAKDKYYSDDEFHAKDLLVRVVSPLGKDHGRGVDGGVVKESLEVAGLLMDNASEAIRIQLCKEVGLKPILEGIIRHYGGGGADHKVITKLANEILAKLPPPSV
ncbi:uncharacterized protein LOC120643864 isoform X2 [Panicum virgatum]|uniref:uncharacterized protein LOC120643864 isoform X2 n=1 Tax=Panicum virgatum TaxID=38727 RepID=UPI0019D5C61E|nr:uncharacterized protein LOC120643864 isoform X2 [Panicum virgatum]